VRGRAGQYSKLYTTPRWRKLRAAQLIHQPLCEMCTEQGKVTEAKVVDHQEPHRGDMEKFWAGPFQSLCEPCHNSHKQREENGGGMMGCDANGFPLDPEHYWAGASRGEVSS